MIFVCCAHNAYAQARQDKPFIAIIIDDIGNDYHAGLRSLHLPGAVTLAFLPYTLFAQRLANKTYTQGKEIMLHLPMEADSGHDMGPGGISHDMGEQEVRETVRQALQYIPKARGVNNHMGSRLTRYPHHMAWVMAELDAQDRLYFVDSRTHVETVAEWVARWARLPHTRRHVFLDHVQNDAPHVRAQFQRLLDLARVQGYALAIGHPFAATLSVLEEELPHLDAYGVTLLPVSEFIQKQEEIKHGTRPYPPRAGL